MDYAVKDGVTVPLGAKMPGTYESERVTYGDSNVKDELDAINSNLTNLFVSVTGATPNSQYGATYLSYPTGFNKNNCTVVSAIITDTDGSKYPLASTYGNITLTDTNIRWYHTVTSVCNAPLEIILIKIN